VTESDVPKQTIYFDYAAATPPDLRVLKAMKPYQDEGWANPGSLHTPGRKARAALKAARASVAKSLGAKPAEIIFTSGSTEAANIAIQGVARLQYTGRLVASAIEHEAVLQCVAAMEHEGHQVGVLTVGDEGIVHSEQVPVAIDDLTTLVCLQYANNEIGTIQPIAQVAAEVARIRADRTARGITTPLYLYCDAAQAGLLNLQVARLGADLLSLGGSKFYGPAGSGILYVRTGVQLRPLLHGGGQERGLRGGTENLAAAVGFAAALELIQTTRTSEAKRQTLLRDELWEAVVKLGGITINGSLKQRLAGNLNLTVAGAAGETLVAYLDAAGFAVATGSACTASSEDPSHVLLALGLTSEQAHSSLRITLGRPTTKAEIGKLIRALRAIVPRVCALSHHGHPVQ
jgi:cysteine desulfurase